jgi:uncharacterized protein (TIGR03437 family)
MRFAILLLVGLSRLAAADAARDSRWRQDLDTLATQLPALHPNLFFQTPRSVFDGAVIDLRAAIPDLSDAEVMVGLAHIVALPGDGHTSLSLTQGNSLFHFLPLQFRWFEDGLFVVAASQSYARVLGSKVIQIADRPVEEVYQAVAGLVSHENDIWVRSVSPNYLFITDVLHALKIAPSVESVRLLLDLNGTRLTLDVASIDLASFPTLAASPDAATGFIPYYRQHGDQNYWFTYIESSRTLYFAYNVCEEQAGLPFAQFNNQLWATFDSKPVERFIIDLRNNTGGNSAVLNPFLASRSARGNKVSAVKPVVIIGRRTYSSAILNAIAIRQGGPVTLVGEPSGGSPNSYGEVQTLTLPNSQLSVSYSTRYLSFPGYPAGSLLPDVTVPIYAADWYARHDPFLAAVLSGAAPGAGSAPQSGTVAVVNSAGFRGNAAVAPGSLAAAFGDFSGVTDGDAAAIPLAKQLNGVQVLVNGQAAPLIAVRAGQINFQVPSSALPGNASVHVQRNGTDLAAGSAQVAVAAPGLFVADALNLANPGAVLDEDSHLVTDASPAHRGSMIQIYASGQGATDPPVDDGAASGALPPAQSRLVPRVYFAGELAEVLFSGLQPAFPGLWQINVRVPESAALSGQTPVFVTIGSNVSNPVTVAVN